MVRGDGKVNMRNVPSDVRVLSPEDTTRHSITMVLGAAPSILLLGQNRGHTCKDLTRISLKMVDV